MIKKLNSYIIITLVFFVINFGFAINSFSQNNVDTIQNNVDTISSESVVKVHSAKKASLYSTFLPGLGQIYNKKYWKTPIIYLGFGALIYSATYNNSLYQGFKSDYLDSMNDSYSGEYPREQLLALIDRFRRSRDLTFVGMAALWGLNVIDASVDAHFFNYDISKDISLRTEPIINYNPYAFSSAGIKLSITF